MCPLTYVLDAELLLLTQPFSRILDSRKTPVTVVLKFLIFKGITPTPEMTKSDLCLAFKSLIESQPDYGKPPMQQIFHSQMPVANNMLALSQNNNMMHPQLCQAPIQQVCIQLLLVEHSLVVKQYTHIYIYNFFLVTYGYVNIKYHSGGQHKKRSKRT